MAKYRFIEHTSDLIVEAEGKTFGEAFENLAEGMFSQMGAEEYGKKTEESEHFRAKSEANTLEELVVNALSEILAETDIGRFTPTNLKVRDFRDSSHGGGGDKEKKTLEFAVYGISKLPKSIIKAVTFHELIVKEEKEKGKWTIRVLFDI